jgi:hypothetical protein
MEQEPVCMISFLLDENGLARVLLFKALSVDGGGNIDVRDSEHIDGDRFLGCNKMDHRRRCPSASTRQTGPADLLGWPRLPFATRVQLVADCFEQLVRAKR